MPADAASGLLPALRSWVARRRAAGAGSPAERWVVLDLETSGMDSAADRVLSIGAVAIRGSEVLVEDSFEALIRQDRPSAHENIAIHGISGSAQRSGRPESEVLREFEQWRDDAPIVGWHLGFDIAFLRQAHARCALDGPTRRAMDLAPLAQVLFADAGNDLDRWLQRFGIGVNSRHSAAADAWMTALLAARLVHEAHRQGARDFRSVRALAGNRRWSGA